MRNTIYFKWFMESLREDQKKDFDSYSINEQKNWYISYLEEHYSVESKQSNLKNHELYTESKERFNKLEETIGFCNWEEYHDNFKLECWNMYDSQGKPQTYIVQFWQEGAGYSLYKLD